MGYMVFAMVNGTQDNMISIEGATPNLLERSLISPEFRHCLKLDMS